ncbi:prolipoprotein diacylglyceryl transferase family protein, partial [Acinetobacter baumannii]
NYPFGMIFPTDPLHLVRHPSQIYQALCEGLLLFIILWWFSSKPRPRMAVSALFLMGYGVARFVMEFFRQPDADQGFILFGWMTKGQILTVPMLLIGLWMMWYAYQKKIYDWG